MTWGLVDDLGLRRGLIDVGLAGCPGFVSGKGLASAGRRVARSQCVSREGIL
jgi:hypothetical protein